MTAKNQVFFRLEDNNGLVIDLFAGGGGASTGIELAIGRYVDIAINHDPAAIALHEMNHPKTKHYCESVWDVDPKEVVQARHVDLLWMSPDCKHFSKAKGGKPVEKKIRGLAWIGLRWAGMVHPDVIMLENVEEFKTWGPVRHGRPVRSKKGETFRQFIQQFADLGYDVEFRELVACDYGAPTKRKRFFMIARCDGKQITWPQPTHGDRKNPAVTKGLLKPYESAASIIDWSIPCKSIFERKKPLAENTLKRIARGIQKFVIDNPEPFIMCNNTGNVPKPVSEPVPVITTGPRNFLVTPFMVPIGYGEADKQKPRINDIQDPTSTIVSSTKQYLVAPTLIQFHSETGENETRGQQLEKPLMTVDGSPRYGLVSAFIHKYFDGTYQGAGASAEAPLPTVTAMDHNSIVTAHIIQMNHNSIGSDMKEPINTIVAGEGHIGEVRAFLIKYYNGDGGQDLNDPLHTVTTDDRFGLVTVAGQKYQIADIGLRMLTPRELYRAQGFPDDYIIDRTKDGKPYPAKEQVARCGNSVPPAFAEALVRSNLQDKCSSEKIVRMDQLHQHEENATIGIN
jgi:DNA (cytosine-5)-methyltransferase 1